MVLCTDAKLVPKFKWMYSAMSGVRHIRGNPPGSGHYTGHVTWWLKLLITRWKLWGSVPMIIRSEVDLDTDTPCSQRTGIIYHSVLPSRPALRGRGFCHRHVVNSGVLS